MADVSASRSPATAVNYAERVVSADGFRLRYFEAGTGEPLIVLHGAGGVRLTPALDMLSAHFRLLVLELPGWGGELNARTQNLDDLAETVAAAARELGLERYQLLGTSLGGAVALHLAVRHPDRVAAMVLEAPAKFRVGARPPVGLTPEQAMRAFRAHPERAPAWRGPDPEARARFWPIVERVLSNTPDYDGAFAELLTTCAVSTLVLFGTKDGVIPSDNGRIYRQFMPNCSFEYVYDAAHAISEDRPEAFVDVVTDFLNRGMGYLIPETSGVINP